MNFPDPARPPIVIVDDCEDDIFLLRHLLRAGGIDNPIAAFSTCSAVLDYLGVRVLLGLPPEQVFIDLKMPGAEDLIQAIRAEPVCNGTKVVIATYSNDPADVARALQLQVDGYMMKFPDPHILAEYVRHGPWLRNPAAVEAVVGESHALCA